MYIDADREIELNSLVREYLLFAEYPKSIESFDGECTLKGRPGSSSQVRQSEQLPNDDAIAEVQNRFLISFNEGDRESFFELWDTQFTETIRHSDPVYQKLEFTFSIYFALFPIHKHVSPIAQKKYTFDEAMATLKTYLSTRGSDLCKTTQFLSFYALPYVPDPTQHPSFKDLFREQWIEEIKERLLSFLDSALRKKDKPKILLLLETKDVKITEDYQKLAQQNRDLKNRIREAEEKDKSFSSKHRNLQNDYHNLIMIASELVQTLASCINGEQITPAYLSSICQRLATFKNHGKAATPKAERISHVEEGRRLEHIPEILENDSNSDQKAEVILASVPLDLDYESLKSEFGVEIEADITTKSVLILEALATTLSSSANKKELVSNLINEDFLNLNSAKTLIEKVFKSSFTNAKHQLTRLMNILSNDSCARAYFLGQHSTSRKLSAKSRVKGPESIVRCLANALIEEGCVDSAYKQNLIGILQKLSMRRFAQTLMIRLNLIPHLHDLLENIHSNKLSEYTTEHGAALLMNLCLRSQGKKACIDLLGGVETVPGRRTLRLLMQLLQYDNEQVKTHVTASLYNLFTNATIREEAKEMDVMAVLAASKDELDDRYARQIEFVIELLNKETTSDQEDEVSEDGREDDTNDVEDDEIDQADKDTQKTLEQFGELYGEQLLRLYVKNGNYAPKPPKTMPTKASVRSSMTSLPDNSEMRRSKAPKLPMLAPAAGSIYASDNEDTLQSNQPLTLKQRNNEPKTKAEKVDFDAGFSTRPKIARTPLSQSLSALPGEMTKVREIAGRIK